MEAGVAHATPLGGLHHPPLGGGLVADPLVSAGGGLHYQVGVDSIGGGVHCRHQVDGVVAAPQPQHAAALLQADFDATHETTANCKLHNGQKVLC